MNVSFDDSDDFGKISCRLFNRTDRRFRSGRLPHSCIFPDSIRNKIGSTPLVLELSNGTAKNKESYRDSMGHESNYR